MKKDDLEAIFGGKVQRLTFQTSTGREAYAELSNLFPHGRKGQSGKWAMPEIMAYGIGKGRQFRFPVPVVARVCDRLGRRLLSVYFVAGWPGRASAVYVVATAKNRLWVLPESWGVGTGSLTASYQVKPMDVPWATLDQWAALEDGCTAQNHLELVQGYARQGYAVVCYGKDYAEIVADVAGDELYLATARNVRRNEVIQCSVWAMGDRVSTVKGSGTYTVSGIRWNPEARCFFYDLSETALGITRTGFTADELRSLRW